MSHRDVEESIRRLVSVAYPDIEVRVEPWSEDPARLAVTFRAAKFALLYPQQRYHYLSHLIPPDFIERQLANSVWFELAPGETPADLVYPDDEVIAEIAPMVRPILERSGFFAALDEVFTREIDPAVCWGDYRVSKAILPAKGFVEAEHFDVFHVLMAQGGYCDCEILYNVTPESELAKRYWQQRRGGPHQQ